MMKLIFQIFVLLSLTIFIQCQSLRGSHMIVTTILDPPYMMLRESPQTNLTGNDRFEGYVVDLLDAISEVLDFKYVLKLSNAGTYGGKDNAGKWNGLIGELIDGRTHIAAGAITVTAERESVVDFTVPFMNLGISILYKKGMVVGRTISDDFKGLLEPFKNYITDIFLILIIVFGIILILLRRKHKTIFFRILLGFWLLFLFFFTSLFIAQLSSYNCLYGNVEYITDEFRTVEDLASQTRIVYGCIAGGSTQSFFRNSENPMYSKMWYNMESRDPTPFVRNSTEGVDRVIAGGYAFFSESTMIEYVVSRYCDLQQVGGLLDSKGYGLAVPKGSYTRETLNHAILVLQEQGKLSELKNKWWFAKNGGGTC